MDLYIQWSATHRHLKQPYYAASYIAEIAVLFKPTLNMQTLHPGFFFSSVLAQDNPMEIFIYDKAEVRSVSIKFHHTVDDVKDDLCIL